MVEFQRLGHQVRLLPTQGANTAGSIAAKAVMDGSTLIVAAGGDGTINEVVGGLAHSHVPLGILPAGTANVLASEARIHKDLAQAARQLCEAKACRIALGQVSRGDSPARYFLMMAGAGLDAAIIQNLDLNLKNRLGKLAYWHGGIRFIRSNPVHFQVDVNGSRYEASFVLTTRVRNYGGDFEIAKRVRLTDNDFEVIVFQNRTGWGYIRLFADIVRNRLYHARQVSIHRAQSVEFSLQSGAPVYIQTDGEAIGAIPCRIDIVPDALTLLLPEAYAGR